MTPGLKQTWKTDHIAYIPARERRGTLGSVYCDMWHKCAYMDRHVQKYKNSTYTLISTCRETIYMDSLLILWRVKKKVQKLIIKINNPVFFLEKEILLVVQGKYSKISMLKTISTKYDR